MNVEFDLRLLMGAQHHHFFTGIKFLKLSQNFIYIEDKLGKLNKFDLYKITNLRIYE